MKCLPFVAVSVRVASVVACSIKEERVVQPAPAPAVVTPVPSGSELALLSGSASTPPHSICHTEAGRRLVAAHNRP
jgi:hypothetical protein